jgi:carnosine N-methyltransferase
MVAGEFLEAYGDQRDCWDCVATCFFIDTAHNPVDYMECIFRLLCPGGYWINLGPLLYHYESQPGQASIELTAAELMSIAEAIGFQIIVDSELNGRCVDGPALDGCFIKSSTYCGNGASMLSYNYRSVLFTARKPVMRVNK